MRLLLYDSHERLLAIVNGYGTIEREINVYDQLNVEVPPTRKNIDLLKKTMKIGVPYPLTKKYQLFKVEKVSLNSKPLTITAIDSAADDLDTQYLIRDKRFINKPLSQVLPVIFEKTTWKYKQFAPDNSDIISFYRISPKEALKKVEGIFGTEVRFLYSIQGNKVIDKTCEVYEQIGESTNIRLVQGINVTNVDYTQDQTRLYTAAVGRGAGIQNTDNDGNATGGYSRSIEFTNISWSKANGDPVDKPVGQDYVEIPEATQKYGWLDENGQCHPRIAKFEFPDEQNVNKLLKETYDKLLSLSQPQIIVETTVAKIGQRVNLGDEVTVVIYEPYKLTYKARVIKVEENPDNDSLSAVTVGFTSVERQAEREFQQEQALVDTKTDFNQALGDTKTNFNQALDDTKTNFNQALDDTKTNFNQALDDTKTNFNQELENQKDESERRYLEHNRKFTELQQETSDKIKSTKESMDSELSAHQQAINEQMEKAKKAIRAVEEKTAKEIDDARDSIMTFVSRNSEGAPLEFYDEQGKLVKGIPPVSTIKSKDGKFELNASGFNFGNHVLGGNGELYADGIYGNKIEGYSIIGAHISGGTIQGVTIEGDSYFRSSGSGGIAVVSGDSGFSFGACAMGSGHISIGTGNWNGTDFYTSGDVICSSVVVGGMALTSSDVAKLQQLKG
ncbi:phage minor structural protein, N-terminal domain protein [Lactobacillus iners LactinV 03V1-b]|nr:phage minor structural protein, N-terminal domain protein [Lactobacillus iners LactinV 03V1-b]